VFGSQIRLIAPSLGMPATAFGAAGAKVSTRVSHRGGGASFYVQVLAGAGGQLLAAGR